MKTIIALLFAAATAVGCSRMQTLRKPGSGSDRELPGSPPAQGATSGLGRKAVHAKRDPATLVAADGTACTVTEARYRETAIGEMVWCSWQ